MSVRIDVEIEGTQRDLINAIGRLIAKNNGYEIAVDADIVDSSNPRSRYFCRTAEAIFVLFCGDSPDYSDEGEAKKPILKDFVVIASEDHSLRATEILTKSMIRNLSKVELQQYLDVINIVAGDAAIRTVKATDSSHAKSIYTNKIQTGK
jgi:hypothetical protein